MTASLRLAQKRFAQALLDRDRAVPDGRAPRRFAVYRNNVHVTLTNALAARFPVCQRLVGEAFFRAMARVFIELAPPRSPLLMTYGDDLPVFLELFPPVRSVPYLADIARLEIAWSQAYHAAEAEPLSAAELAGIPPDAWDRARVQLHPSVRVVISAHPIVSIWRAHADPAAPESPRPSQPENALVSRPGSVVDIAALPAGAATFIVGLTRHGSLPLAAHAAITHAPRGDLMECLATVIAARLLVGVEVRRGRLGTAE
jgi:hypothetical protein